MTRERECLACGGTGGDWLPSERCLACLGTGRQTDRITVQDALADAETLRLNHPRARVAFASFETLIYLCGGLCGPDDAALVAQSAARSIFTAVPGLRGEFCS